MLQDFNNFFSARVVFAYVALGLSLMPILIKDRPKCVI